MTNSEKMIKIGIIGVGSIGSAHARALCAGMVKHAVLTAVCDIRAVRREKAAQRYPGVTVYATAEELIAESGVDAVIIATPHYEHPRLAIMAFEAGLHVLSEKPMAVYCLAAREMLAAAEKSGKNFAVMFNQRNDKLFALAHDLVQSGALGELKRSVWIITNWYRKQAYYNSSTWRATWSGEGGGVLLNQAPHNLDLWQWICGMPSEIYAECDVAKYHTIEVEDDATIMVRYPNGARGVFIASTGEFPGTNRLEIVGTRGKIVVENGKLTHTALPMDEREFVQTPELEDMTPVVTVFDDEDYNGHIMIIENFVNAILNGTPLLSPGAEAINELTISNAAYLSAWTGERVTLPMDDERYFALLQERIAISKRADTDEEDCKSSADDEYKAKWNTKW